MMKFENEFFPVRILCALCVLCVEFFSAPRAATAAGPVQFKVHEINPESGIGLGLTISDINGDGRPDIVGLTDGETAWYENPTWERRLIAGRIKGSNVCVAARDLDGDKLPELVVGADWQFDNTDSGGSLHLLRRGADANQPWRITDLLVEPTIHRIRWADTDGDGADELVVAPLKGRGSRGPDFKESGVRLMLLRPPANPEATPWPMEVATETLHVLHNIIPVRSEGRDAILAASFEGVSFFRRNRDGSWTGGDVLVEGNPQPWPQSGAGEIKVGHLRADMPVMATIEPWHGTQAVVYLPGAPGAIETQQDWTRLVVDDALAQGHALAWADFDGDGSDELVAGFREKAGPRQVPGLNLYDFKLTGTRFGGVEPSKQIIDDGGMATEDAAAHDMNGDGRPDVIAIGRATKNLRLYENLGPAAN